MDDDDLMQEATKLYLFGGHCVEVLQDKSEKETVFNDLWQLDLKSWQVCLDFSGVHMMPGCQEALSTWNGSRHQGLAKCLHPGIVWCRCPGAGGCMAICWSSGARASGPSCLAQLHPLHTIATSTALGEQLSTASMAPRLRVSAHGCAHTVQMQWERPKMENDA